MGIQVIKGGSISAYLKLAGDVALTSSLVSVVDQTNTVSGLQLATASIGLTMPTFLALPNWTNTLGTKDGFSSQQTVAVASVGTGVFRLIRNAYTINNTAAQTGSVTGYFLNATETALNGITHNLMDLQVNSATRFFVSRLGTATAEGLISTGNIINSSGGSYQWTSRSRMNAPSDGVITILNNASNDFGRLQLGGTTSSFPAIKRNGTVIDFRLADDSAYCDITAKVINAESVGLMAEFRNTISTALLINNGAGSNSITLRVRNTADGLNRNFYMDTLNLYLQKTSLGSVSIGTDVINASAVFQIDSTTKGFLMPRQTTAQILLIATPAAGLQVYNTTLNQPCFFDGTIWNKVNHSPM